MKKYIIAVFILAILLLPACKDISGKAKADFGSSPKDKAVVDYFNGKYGDITQKGEPRFLEPLLTTDIVESLPVDKVLKYSKDTQNFFLWFVYDNFADKDAIDVEWKYLDTNIVVYTFKTTAGGDFGRGSFILERPDTGWPTGKYRVTLSGKGATSVVDFEVIDGKTVTEKLPFDLGGVNAEINNAAKPEVKPEPSAGIKPEEAVELYNNGNIYACGYTDTSSITITEDVFVTKLRMWYYWEKGETKLTYTLTKDGASFASGELERGGCDPYQTSWCEANYLPDKEFPKGTYVLKAGKAKLCQNSGSKGNGMYVVYGKKLGNGAATLSSSKEYYQVDFSDGNHKRFIKGTKFEYYRIAGTSADGTAPIVWLSLGKVEDGNVYPASFSWDVPDYESKTLVMASVFGWHGPVHNEWITSKKKFGKLTVVGTNGEKKTFDLIYGVHSQEWNIDIGKINNPPITEVIYDLPSQSENKAFVNKFDLGDMKVKKITAEVTDIGKWYSGNYGLFLIYGMTLLK
jgi:hypothetical protein